MPRTHVPGPLLATEGGKGGSDGKRGNERAGGTRGAGRAGKRAREPDGRRRRGPGLGGQAEANGEGAEGPERRTDDREGTGPGPAAGRRRGGRAAPRGSRHRRHATHPETHRRLRAGERSRTGGRDRRRRRRRAWGGSAPPQNPRTQTSRDVAGRSGGRGAPGDHHDGRGQRGVVAGGGRLGRPYRGDGVDPQTPRGGGARRADGAGAVREARSRPPNPTPFGPPPFSRSPPPPAERPRARTRNAGARPRARQVPTSRSPPFPLSSPVPRRTGGERLVREQGGSAAALSEPR